MSGGWRRARTRRLLVVLSLAGMCLLSACASGSRVAGKPTATAFATWTPGPAVTDAPTATPVTDPLAVCTADPGARVSVASTHVGALDGGWQALPANLAMTPQPASLSVNGQMNASLALKGVTLWVDLNAPAGGHTGNVCAVTVKITGYHPLQAPVPNVTKTCLDLPWDNPGGVETGADCGAIGGVYGLADMTFTSTAPGASASIALHDVNDPQRSQVVQVPTGSSPQTGVLAHVEVPASGTYTFSVGIWQDRTGPVVFTTMQATFVVDATHEWSGRACSDPAMQSLMPAPTNPPSSFICPGGPPTQE